MKKWCTEIKALDAKTGEMKTWVGDTVEAPTWYMAQEWCNNNKGYLRVSGELLSEIPTKSDGITPDWDNKIDYDEINNN